MERSRGTYYFLEVTESLSLDLGPQFTHLPNDSGKFNETNSFVQFNAERKLASTLGCLVYESPIKCNDADDCVE